MTDVMSPLDGNAAAGKLEQLFAFDVTSALILCGTCSRKGPIAELQLYGGDTGLVLRCRSCGEVNLRMLESPDAIHIDLSGAARLTVRMT